ncbi:polyphosphate kinase [Flavobacteriales bacterium]|nr:polyphosphate kinase [Flavobacteriales bacterium]
MLNNIDSSPPNHLKKKEIKRELKQLKEKMIAFQKKMNAQGKYSLLLVFQGMDASGKDGATRRVLEGVNPSGIKVKSYKKPTDEEFAHDFLWRVHQHTPAKGMIQVFNRSHYEDILVPSVMGYIPKEEIEKRYELINSFEKLLEHNGTKVLKFYLHVSKEEQLVRLQERIDNPEKHFKHKDGDWETRENWDSYMGVYQSLFDKCNDIPWHIIPSDENWYKTNLITEKIIAAFESMDLEWPELKTEKF